MAEILIQSLQVSDDDVFIAGIVDGKDVSAHAWLSHLYPPKDQDIVSATRGCQTDQDRISYLSNQLAIAAGLTPQQELASKVTQALAV